MLGRGYTNFLEFRQRELLRIPLPRTPGDLGIGEEGPGKRLGTRPDLPEPALPRALRAAHDVGALRKVGGVCLRLEAGGPVHRAVVECLPPRPMGCLLPRTSENAA